MIPTPGRIVAYTLTEQDAEQINRRRADEAAARPDRAHDGAQVHVGNTATAGETYPLVITRVWGQTEGSAVNGQVLLDGNDTLWVTSRTQATHAESEHVQSAAGHWDAFLIVSSSTPR